jgi:hypothetical protein
MALQRMAGNRAVAALARQQRAPRTMLQRRRASPRPAPKPNPPWAVKGIDNPENDCQPLSSAKDYHDAKLTWDLYAAFVPDKLTERCHCDLVGEAYAKYLEAQGGSFTYKDDGNCISRQLGEDDVTHDTDAMTKRNPNAVGIEEVLIDRWRKREAGILWYSLTGTTRSMEIDYVEATKGNIQPADVTKLSELEISNELTYMRNDLAGGLLFGSGTSDHITPDSEYGFDTRHVSGTIKITRTDDGRNANFHGRRRGVHLLLPCPRLPRLLPGQHPQEGQLGHGLHRLQHGPLGLQPAGGDGHGARSRVQRLLPHHQDRQGLDGRQARLVALLPHAGVAGAHALGVEHAGLEPLGEHRLALAVLELDPQPAR